MKAVLQSRVSRLLIWKPRLVVEEGDLVQLRLPNNIDFICPNIDIEYCSKSPKYCQYIDNIDLETAPNIDNILNIDSGISDQILQYIEIY